MSTPQILIVEDNPLDAELIRWSLAEAGFMGTPVVVNDGLEAIALLRGDSPYEHAKTPHLVILDLNLRLVDGPEVLQFIRGSAELKDTKVVILSSSPEYVMRSKAARADRYFSKSSSLDVYAGIGKKILDCYFEADDAKGDPSYKPGPPSLEST